MSWAGRGPPTSLDETGDRRSACARTRRAAPRSPQAERQVLRPCSAAADGDDDSAFRRPGRSSATSAPRRRNQNGADSSPVLFHNRSQHRAALASRGAGHLRVSHDDELLVHIKPTPGCATARFSEY